MRVVAEWLVDAHAAAHADPATKRLARLVLGVQTFAANMGWAGVFDKPYKEGLQKALQQLGAPLAAAFVRDELRAKLGGFTMPEQPLVAAARRRCEAAGDKFVVRTDMDGGVPVPAAWELREPCARQFHERVYMHVLKMAAMALNEDYHAMMRTVLAPFAVGDKGLMQKKGGVFYICPEKGLPRMDGKRVTDHAHAPGCRPALNIDVLRVLAVFATPEQLLRAAEALRAKFGGCARFKVGSVPPLAVCCCCHRCALWVSLLLLSPLAALTAARSLPRWASPRPTRTPRRASTCGSS